MNSASELENLFARTPLVGKSFQAFRVPGQEQDVFSTPLETDKLLSSWETARQYLAETGRWPVIVEPWGGLEEYLDRFPYELEKLGAYSPQELVDAVAGVDLKSELQEWQVEAQEPSSDWLETELELTKHSFGVKPEAEEFAHYQTHLDLDRGLMEWEEKQKAKFDSSNTHNHIDWFEPSRPHLFLLPTPDSWSTLAYLPWYEQRSVTTMALLKSWHERFGAELVCHYSTMLQFRVTKPPTTLQEAWELATEQVLVSPCTTALPGVSIRDHARALVEHSSWFLHQRP